jgi:hypothetical protein
MPPAVDDFSVLRVSPFSDAIAKFEQLITQNRRAFLLGAGASKCAGLPLMSDLTTKTLASPKLSAPDQAILTGLVSSFIGAKNANIEDYLSELIDLRAIAERRKDQNTTLQTVQIGGQDFSEDELGKAVTNIKLTIVEALTFAPDLDVHRAFVRAIHKSIRPGKWATDQSVDYLVLNYDTLLEDALALETMPFSDGLDGGSIGWWNPSTFSRPDLVARVLKLHGSINWCQFAGETLPRRIENNHASTTPGTEQVLIWPASTKYRETQRDPFAQLADRARKVLKPSTNKDLVLIICGYSFRDSHINLEIDRALHDSDGQLAVLVFTSDSALSGQLKSWNDDSYVKDQVLIFAKGGFFHGSTHATAGDLPWWKFENVTRLLGGER